MSRTLNEALHRRPLLFEPVPPMARTSPARSAEQIEAVARLVAEVPRIDAINLPELVDENHDGRPYYRTVDPRIYGRALGERTGRPILVNKVVAHLDGPDALKAWVEETVAYGIRHAVLVGGSSRYIPYPGPTVAEANRVCAPAFARHGGGIGNIAIPQRQGEPYRMLSKTRGGASFFTTQLVFGAGPIVEMVAEYGRLCLQAMLRPSAVLVSLAPIADEMDAEFVRWLGADIPLAAEREIVAGEEAGAGERSVRHALAVWDDLRAGLESAECEVPLGVNVEQISVRHLATARRMVEAFADRLGPAPPP